MKALVYHGAGERSWDTVDDPGIVEPTDAVVRIDTSTVCGTDLHILKGDVLETTPPSPSRPPGSLVRLPDGSAVRIRAIHRDDTELLLDHFAHLSDEARYRRFLAPIQHLTAQQLNYFTHPDHRRHEALFALDEDGRPVGVARYISSSEHPETAELAAAVVDGWRGRGVGSALVDELARRARNAGIARFTALMLPDNQPMRAVLRHLGPLEMLDPDPTGNEVAVALEPAPTDPGRPPSR